MNLMRKQSFRLNDDLSGLGLDLSEEDLLARLREARSPLSMGRAGDFELLGVAGRGGQGIVYQALQPGTGRLVALKRLFASDPASWQNSRESARLTREIEIEASLQHPNIVTVYGVEFVNGQPLLAMEWVDGLPLDKWLAACVTAAKGADTGREACNAPGAAEIREFLRLFVKICDAVHHAHQRGVIHRDLKPSNILVDEEGEPRIVDFGLARLVHAPDGRPRGIESLTVSGGFLGTLGFAAPEQVQGKAHQADIRADVFSIGCLLYLALTGRPPFAAGGDLEAITRAVCSEEPPKPSSVNRALNKDIDAIIAQAIAKEPERRYQAVEAMAADLRSYLAGRPVAARGGSTWYHLRKFIRRRRAVAAGIMIATLAVTAGGALATWQSLRASAQAAHATDLNDFLLRLLVAADPYETGTRFVGTDLLDQAAADIGLRFSRYPQREAAARQVLAKAYLRHEPEKAYDQAKTAWTLQRRTFGDRHVESLATADLVGEALDHLGRYHEACDVLRQTLEVRRQSQGPQHADTLRTLGRLVQPLHFLGHREEAKRTAQAASEGLELTLGPLDRDAILAAADYALTIAWTEGDSRAEPLRRSLVERATTVFGVDHPRTRGIIAQYAMSVLDHNPQEAERLLKEVIAGHIAHLGTHHTNTSGAIEALGRVYYEQGRCREAGDLFAQVMEIRSHILGDSHTTTHMAAMLTQTMRRWHDNDCGTLPLARRAVEHFVGSLGPAEERTLYAMCLTTHLLIECGAAAEAEALARRMQAHQQSPTYGALLARALRAQGKTEEALRHAAAAAVQAEHTPVNPKEFAANPALIRGVYGGCLLDQGRIDEAEIELLAAWTTWKEQGPIRYRHPEIRDVLRDLVAASQSRGDAEAAAHWQHILDELLLLTG
jgi:eukaryotic-like serine/threonine-protein kinase